jgi:manganese transport protein
MLSSDKIIKQLKETHPPSLKAKNFLKYLGTGVLVTVGFIDPGNWAANIAAGSTFGYSLLWVITISTVILIILQQNAAQLGIVSGMCLAEAATAYLKPYISRPVLFSAILAVIATAFAEIIGSAIALNMLFHLPIKIGAVLSAIFCSWLLATNSYKKLENLIIGFVSLIGISFLFELNLPHINWGAAISSSFVPSFPHGSLFIVMAMLGAVVMPHNLFLHSEIINNREWKLEGDAKIKKHLKYSFFDTLFSMLAGWAINCAIIIVTAAVFFDHHVVVTQLQQAVILLRPILGHFSSIIFAIALLFAGIASATTAGMAGGSIFAGLYKEIYDISDVHSEIGAYITYFAAVLVIFFISDFYKALIFSQVALSIQLPFTIFLQIYLTSSPEIMGKYVSNKFFNVFLWFIGFVVVVLNILLVIFSFK